MSAGESTPPTLALSSTPTRLEQAEEAARLAQQQRESAQRRCADIITSVDGIVWEADAQTFRFTFVSAQAERMLGSPLARWIDEPGFWADHIHPEDREFALAYCLACTREMKDHRFDYRLRAADGRYLWMQDVVTVLVEEGRPKQLRGIMVDITARKRAEEQLRESEERYSTLVKASSLIVWTTGPDGREYHMPGWVELTGQSEEEARGDGWLDALHPADRARAARAWAEGRRTHTPYEAEYRVRTKGGGYRHIASRAVPIIRSGRVREWIGSMQDITERKLAEEQLRATSEQLRALTASLSSAREEEGVRIAREIHDELGSALTSLRWDLEEVDKTLAEGPDASRLGGLRAKIGAMTKLIDTTVNSVRRISSELRPSVLDDLGLAAAIEWQAEQFQARTGIVCRCDCPHEEVELTRGQSTAIFRIFQEALTNVLRHARATRVHITLERDEGDIVLSVRDDGRGITEGEKQGRQTLGLLGMRERAHLVGGEVNVAGVEGEGTTVVVRVPLARGVESRT